MVAQDADTSGVTFYAQHVAPPHTNDAEATVATDSAGVSHMLWNRDGKVWHAYHDAATGEWTGAQVVSLAPGSSLSLVAAPNLIDGAAAGLMAVWEQGSGNTSEIYFAVARRAADGGFEWSAPMRMTNNVIRDSSPTAVVVESGDVLVTYLKSNDDIQDDTDVYYMLLHVSIPSCSGRRRFRPRRRSSSARIGRPARGMRSASRSRQRSICRRAAG